MHFRCYLRLYFQPLQAPYLGAIKALLLVLVLGAHSGAIFSPFQAPFKRYLNATVSASFSRCRRNLRRSKSAILVLFEAAVSTAASAIFRRCSLWLLVLVSRALDAHSEHHSATFRAPFSPHSKPVNEGIGLHSGGCSPSHWSRHAWRCWEWSSPRVAEN